jgi:DNA-binding XRE family transcriptional regulator
MNMKRSYELTESERRALTRARHEAGYTQAELAAEVGCSPQTISNYETGKYPVGGGMLSKFMDLLPRFEGVDR